MKKFTILILLTMFLHITVSSQSNYDGCTIGVAHGSSTQDGRPLVWKTRDYDSNHMEMRYSDVCDYNYIYICDDSWTYFSTSGLNEHGLALLVSDIYDLTPAPTGPTYHAITKHALGYCKTIDEFQAYLDSTNITGRRAVGNYAMIDSTGAAAIFESGGYEYWRFDAQNEPNGYIIRTNFTINGGGTQGIQRYNRSSALVEAFHSGDSLNHKSLIRYQMRDFSDYSSQPYPIPYLNQISGKPYGYFYTGYSICNSRSTSTAVIRGILPDEKPELSTMWAMLGHPAASITSPYWPVGPAPPITQGDLCDIALMIKEVLFDIPGYSQYINSHRLKDTIGGGLWTCTFPTEDYILDTAELFLNNWRGLDSIPVVEMLNVENELAEMVYDSLYYYPAVGVEVLADNNEFLFYPNPTSNRCSIVLPPGSVETSIQIINMQGQIIMHQKVANANFSFNVSTFPKGLYVIRLYTNKSVSINKLIIQ